MGFVRRTLLMRCLQRPIQHMHRGIFLESNDKKYARIKALKILIDAIEEKIKETD